MPLHIWWTIVIVGRSFGKIIGFPTRVCLTKEINLYLVFFLNFCRGVTFHVTHSNIFGRGALSVSVILVLFSNKNLYLVNFGV